MLLYRDCSIRLFPCQSLVHAKFSYKCVGLQPHEFSTLVRSHDHQLNWWHDFDPIRVFYQPRLKTHEDLPTAFLSQAAAKAALFFAAEILFPRKRIIVFLHRHLIVGYVFLQLIPYILCDRFLISADCIHIVSSTPEMTISISIL